jgi:hypothetical protein
MATGDLQRTPHGDFEFPQMRPSDRVLFSRLRPASSFIFGSLVTVPGVAAFALAQVAAQEGHAWLFAPAILFGAASWMLSSRYWKREWPAQLQRDDLRADEIVASPGARLPMRRAAAYGWPIFLTVLSALFVPLIVLNWFELRILLIASALIAVSAAAWVIAIRLAKSAGVIGVDGIEIGAMLIPWSAISSLGANPIGRGGSARMTMALFDRELARKVGASAGVSSVGYSGTELWLSLDGSVEAVAVKYQVAQLLLGRARQEIARDGGRRRAAQTKAHLAAHPEDAAKIERQLLAEFEQEMARARARLDALKGRRPS